jgi:basic amino acid/polyamine antiporter, APA family
VPIVPYLGIIFNGYMMYKLGWVNWARLIIWLAIGMVVYFTYSIKHSRLQRGELTPSAPLPEGDSYSD